MHFMVDSFPGFAGYLKELRICLYGAKILLEKERLSQRDKT